MDTLKEARKRSRSVQSRKTAKRHSVKEKDDRVNDDDDDDDNENDHDDDDKEHVDEDEIDYWKKDSDGGKNSQKDDKNMIVCYH